MDVYIPTTSVMTENIHDTVPSSGDDSIKTHTPRDLKSITSASKNCGALGMLRSADCKCANSDLEPDVERLILDYMNWTAMESLIEIGACYVKGGKVGAATLKNTIDAVKRAELSGQVFANCNHRHSAAIVNALEFSRRLIRFTSAFIMRNFSAELKQPVFPVGVLASLRRRAQSRLKSWLQDEYDSSKVEERLLSWYKSYRPVRNSPRKCPDSIPNLGDLLLPLIELIDLRSVIGAGTEPCDRKRLSSSSSSSSESLSSSAESSDGWWVTTLLQELIAEMMLQSVLEKKLPDSIAGEAEIVQAFAWGPAHSQKPRAETQSSDHSTFERVFSPVKDSDEPEWREIRLKYLKELALPAHITSKAIVSDPDERTREHLCSVQDKYPRQEFDRKMVQFLDALLHAQTVPILRQLERGERIIIDNKELTIEDELVLRNIVQKQNQ